MLLSTAFPCRHITLGQCFVIPLIRLTHVAFFSKKYQRPPQDKLDEKDIEESFCRGAGPGGQKINKSMNKVRLRHIPTGATVAVQEQRDLTTNRSLARKLLRDKVDLIINGVDSKIGRKITKIQKRKCKTARQVPFDNWESIVTIDSYEAYP